MKKDISFLNSIPGVLLEVDKDLTKYSTMRLNAVGDLITVKNLQALKSTVKELSQKGNYVS